MSKDQPITVIEIRLSERDGYYYASSPDMPELHVCGTDKKLVMNDVCPIVKRLYKLNYGLDVGVRQAASHDLKPTKKAAALRDHFVRLLAFAEPELAIA